MAETSVKTRPDHVLEDPSAKAVARVYAVAFLDAAAAGNHWEALQEFTSFQDDVVKPNAEFAGLLTSQAVRSEDKLALLDRTLKEHASEFFLNFLKVLARHDRLDLLSLILSETWHEHERRVGQKRVQVKSAVPLADDQLESIKQKLQSVLNTEPILIPSVDEQLIGGLVIQVGDTVYDGSLKTQLKNLRQRLREGYLNEIQSGRDRFSHPEGN